MKKSTLKRKLPWQGTLNEFATHLKESAVRLFHFRKVYGEMDIDRLKVERNRKFWYRFLNADPEQFTARDWDMALTLALQWNTCACGSMDDGIPRFDSGRPHDTQLNQLGCEFPDAIEERDIEKAREIFRLIERRAAKVIQDEQS